MTTLGGIWDGEEHRLTEDDGYFTSEGSTFVIDGWTEEEEEDELSPFESASRTPILKQTHTKAWDGRFPNAALEQSWATLSIILGAFAQIVGTTRKQYERINHTDNTLSWTFQAEQFITERM